MAGITVNNLTGSGGGIEIKNIAVAENKKTVTAFPYVTAANGIFYIEWIAEATKGSLSDKTIKGSFKKITKSWYVKIDENISTEFYMCTGFYVTGPEGRHRSDFFLKVEKNNISIFSRADPQADSGYDALSSTFKTSLLITIEKEENLIKRE